MTLPLLIASFHRSGSSLTAQLLHAAGMHLGDKLLGAKPSNPHGHFEDTEIIRFHDELLTHTGHAWHSEKGVVTDLQMNALHWIWQYANRKSTVHAAYGVKDPRLCLTVRHWHAALGEVRLLFIHRSARASCASFWHRAVVNLRANQGVAINTKLAADPSLVARIYIHNVRSFLSFYESLPDPEFQTLFISHRDLVDGFDMIGEIRERWTYPLQNVDIDEIFDGDAITIERGLELSSIPRVLLEELDALDERLDELSARNRRGST